jgi:hypothetical protein
VNVFVPGYNGAGGTAVHNPVGFLVRSTMRVVRTSVLVVVPAGLLVLGAGAASAQEAADTTVRAEPSAVTFGLLGPVGLVAVALGIVGMTAGVVRQRRKARAAAIAETPTAPIVTPALVKEPIARPALTPSQHHP